MKLAISISPDLRGVLSIAREEVIRLRHPQLGTKHLLLALLSSGDDTTMLLLDHCCITAQQFGRHLRRQPFQGAVYLRRWSRAKFPLRRRLRRCGKM